MTPTQTELSAKNPSSQIHLGIWAESLCGPPNGTGTLIGNLVKHLSETKNVQVTLYCPFGVDQTALSEKYPSPNVRICIVSGNKWVLRIRWLCGLHSLTNLAGAQDVWISGWYWPLGPRDVPLIPIFHDLRLLDPDSLLDVPLLRRLIWRFVTWMSASISSNRASKVVAVSNYTKNCVLEHFPMTREKIVRIYNGVDLKGWEQAPRHECDVSVRGQLGLPNDGEYVLALGAQSEQKNFSRLVSAFARAHTLQKSAFLILVGKHGPATSDIKATIRQHALEHRVFLTGTLSDREIKQLMHGARVFCFPSLYEGFGIPIIEAFAAGTPVVTSNCGSMLEIAEHAAVLVDPNSTSSIAGGLELAWTNETLRAAVIEKGLQRSRQFDWEKCADDYFNLIRLVSHAKKSQN